jgi:hypothetical protein
VALIPEGDGRPEVDLEGKRGKLEKGIEGEETVEAESPSGGVKIEARAELNAVRGERQVTLAPQLQIIAVG